MPDSLSEHASKPRLIMIVDDNAANVLIASTLLEEWGHEFRVADNGAKAVELFQKDDYSLILMDLQMPIMSGMDATKMIRHYEGSTERKPVPIIALTANGSPAYREQCFASGMNDFILKPYLAEELAYKIADNLKH